MTSSPESCKYRCGLDLRAGQPIYYAYQSEVNIIGNRLAFTEKRAFDLFVRGGRFHFV